MKENDKETEETEVNQVNEEDAEIGRMMKMKIKQNQKIVSKNLVLRQRLNY